MLLVKLIIPKTFKALGEKNQIFIVQYSPDINRDYIQRKPIGFKINLPFFI